MRALFRHREEEELVFAFLAGTPGIFVEVGANDPVDGSQTWRLEQDGWSGLLVEPLAECAERLRQQRKAHVAEVACGPRALDGSRATFKVAGVASTLASEFINYRVSAEEVREVRVAALDSLLAELAIPRIDFLSLDVEGYELEVLDGLSLDRYAPRLILIEDRVRDLTRHRYLTAHGYKVVRRTGANGWYVPEASDFPVSPYGRLQLFWRYRIEWWFRGHLDRWRRRRHQAAVS